MENLLLKPGGGVALFYSGNEHEPRCIGHLRGDFGHNGKEFWTSWFPHKAEVHNTPEFKAVLQDFVDTLRQTMLKDLTAMRSYLREHPNVIEHDKYDERHGYRAMIGQYAFYIRCNPNSGDYNFYIYCYLRGEIHMSKRINQTTQP